MARRHLSSVLHYIRGLEGRMQADASTDGQLLQQFVAARDERAFATLVERHGPRVLGVCRRVLANADEVDDAFQATFLVLAGKARSISKREAVSSWLCGVAYRVALKARARATRHANERPLCDCTDDAQEDPAAAAGRRELCTVVGEELSQLPAKFLGGVSGPKPRALHRIRENRVESVAPSDNSLHPARNRCAWIILPF